MTGNNYINRTGGGYADRQTIRVCAPTAHSGIGDALRRAFTPPSTNGIEREFVRMLERV